MISLPITYTIAAALAALMFPLTLGVSLRRAGLGKEMGDLAGVAFGDAGDDVLRRRIRAFGNFIEYAPFCLILLALFESAGASPNWVWAIGGLLVLGRITHALGMLYSNSPAPRAAGMFMTWTVVTGNTGYCDAWSVHFCMP